MTFAISGLATAEPAHSIQQSAAAKIAAGLIGGQSSWKRDIFTLFERTTVRSRGSVLFECDNGSEPEQSFYWPSTGPEDRGPATVDRMQRYATEAVPLAINASERALIDGGILPEQVTHLVTVSCTGFFSPGVDIALIKQLGLPRTVGRLNVGFMGCHGALNGLRAVQAIGQSDPLAVVLMCAVELCSLHYQYGADPQQLVANALFADGAAALVGCDLGETAKSACRVASCGSCLIPGSEDAMTWRIGNHGFVMGLSPGVPTLIGQHLRPWLETWLSEAGRELSEIRSWAVHPGGPKILTSVAETLELPPSATEVSEQVLVEHGNMSSPTVLYILDRLRQNPDWQPCVLLGFGPGLIAEAALVE